MGWGDFLESTFDYAKSVVESKVGYTMVERDKLNLLEAVQQDHRALGKELDLLGYHTLDYLSGSPHEVKPKRRVDSAKQSRMAWMWDPMAGAATDLMNDFVFGRGVPPPRARNPDVQKVIDTAWKDPDNAAVLTGYQAQVAMGTDLSLQSNIFVLIFKDGEDDKVKLGLLDHDTVFDAVRDPENRLRVLYYVATHTESEWDFDNNCVRPVTDPGKPLGTQDVRYYAHWKNVEDAETDASAGLRDAPPKPPKEKMGEGLVYHIAVNRTTEMVFGVPQMQRTLRWFSAYNDLMSARVDMAKAAAELIMKRKVKASPSQLGKLAMGAMGRGGELATTPDPTRLGGRPAGTVVENENVTHEGFKLDSGAGNANVDATMIRSQVSAGTRFPQHYLGDQGNANLATATAMDLPVTKMVESRQELFEQLCRAFTDMVIERAVKAGTLKGDLPGEEDAEVTDKSTLGEADAQTKVLNKGMKLDGSPDGEGDPVSKDGKMDLGYEFKMPNPLRRLMSDLATTIQTIAKTFDPNGTNIELSRTLLTVALGEALELQDPSDAVERILPPGWQDPVQKLQLAAGQAQIDAASALPPAAPAPGTPAPTGKPAPPGGTPAAGGEPGSGKRGPYGTKSGATPPEQTTVEALLAETRFDDLPGGVQDASDERALTMEQEFEQIVAATARRMADEMPPVGHSG